MKRKYSTHWKASKQPRKQRKYRANAPLHVRRKMVSVNLSKELRKKYSKRNFPICKGDNVKIMRGAFAKKSGKIELVNLQKMKVRIDGIYRTKKDGTKVSVWFDPSNLQIKELNLDDKMRKGALERKVSESKKEGKENISKPKQDKDEEQAKKKKEVSKSSSVSINNKLNKNKEEKNAHK